MGSIAKPAIDHGHRLVPTTIDDMARETPSRTFASIPRSHNLKDGYRDVTCREFARAVDRTAEFIEGQLGRSETLETVAYMGASDLRYNTVVVAASKIGWTVLLVSPRNSLEGQVKLFESSKVKAILTSRNYHLQEGLVKKTGLQALAIPELDDLLAEGPYKHYEFRKTWDEAKADPFLILHTSGSTGFPKPVVLKHAWFASLDRLNALPDFEGYTALWAAMRNKKLFISLPPFHAFGIVMSISMPCWNNSAMYWGPANTPISPVLIDEVLASTSVDMLFTAPSILEELVQDPSSFDKLANLTAIGFGGGPLSQETGDKISRHTQLLNVIGSTECATFPYYLQAKEDWMYFHLDPRHKGIEMRDVGDGQYEMVVVRDPSTDDLHSTWTTFPELSEYSLHDLYSKHPTKPNHWKYIGRADDVIVLSNGEKINPTGMEETLRTHPDVKGALVVGQARFVPAAIIELRDGKTEQLKTSEAKARFLEEEIWPLAVKANSDAPAHGQLSRDKIVLADPSKPFLRAGKGTVQRPSTVKLYASIIDELYRGEEEAPAQDWPKIDVGKDVGVLEDEIGALVGTVLLREAPGKEEDFFAAGMDSLHVMKVVKMLNASLTGAPEVSTRLIYANPSTAQLVAALKQLASSKGAADTTTREEKMEETVRDFVSRLPAANSKKSPRPKGASQTVILTGSSGSLGSYLLHILLSSPNVSKVYCLNRRAGAAEQQAKTNASRGLISEWDGRVEFLQAEMSKPFLGLQENVYQRLVDEVSVIIHNQWQVDFNLSLASFLPHIKGTFNLINLSASSSLSPPILFTSSIGTLGNWSVKHPNVLIPEVELTDPSIPLQQGYGESKWVAERVLHAAAEKSGVSSTVFRVGQIAGPVESLKGAWNKQEWLPTIVASSKYLGVVPADLAGQATCNWIPVDTIARVIFELMDHDLAVSSSSRAAQTNYYHLTNPRDGNWTDLVPSIQSFYAKEKEIKAVPFSEWVDILEQSSRDEGVDAEKNPGVKLVEFYRAMVDGGIDSRLETDKTREASESMRNLSAVNGAWMERWLTQWGF